MLNGVLITEADARTKTGHPLGGYAFLSAIFNSLLFLSTRSAPGEPKATRALSGADALLLIPAVHKLSEIITKDRVTEPFRAPFVEMEKSSEGKVKEQPRGNGVRQALGSLLTCPYCIAPWVTTGFLFGFRFRPRQARLIAIVFAVVTGSDFLTAAYGALKKKA